MRSTIALLVGISALFAAAPTNASADPTLDRATAIARGAWPDSPCFGRERVEVVYDLRDLNGEPVGGLAYPFDGSCRVQVEADQAPLYLCSVITHELGHLAGLANDGQHVDYRGYDIMRDHVIEGAYTPCERMYPRLTLRALRKWAKRTRHRIRGCKREDRRQFECRARGPGLPAGLWQFRLEGGRIDVVLDG